MPLTASHHLKNTGVYLYQEGRPIKISPQQVVLINIANVCNYLILNDFNEIFY